MLIEKYIFTESSPVGALNHFHSPGCYEQPDPLDQKQKYASLGEELGDCAASGYTEYTGTLSTPSLAGVMESFDRYVKPGQDAHL